MCNSKLKNVFGQVPSISEMQSEGGAAGALHGAIAAGGIATTFTASQGLLLFLPNMWKIAGEGLPCVIHVSARALAGQALSIFGEHSDVMAARQTGFGILFANTVQEAHDMALVAHIATLKSRVPFMHAFDGFRTSHEVNKIKLVEPADVKALMPWELVEEHRSQGLNPAHPALRGTNQGPDIFFQLQEASNPRYLATAEIVKSTLADVAKVTGRSHKLFEYTGHPDAEDVLVLMGSAVSTVQETVAYANRALGAKFGVLNVRLFRPWSAADFLAVLPKSARRVAVLDRMKEAGAQGEPLLQDVMCCVYEGGLGGRVSVVGGRYGLGSRDLTPAGVLAVFDNLVAAAPKKRFTVGIEDDVTYVSCGPQEEWSSCLFYKLVLSVRESKPNLC